MNNINQITPPPSAGEIYKAYDDLEKLDRKDNWAFGDKLRRRDTRHAAKAVIGIAGQERVDQVVADTHQWLADKEESMTAPNNGCQS